jgi:peptidoglycan hydrolase-like protein with peptidoglycan-binding domain
MATFKLGSKGEEVRRIQEKLKALGIYKGPVDGDFGGGTEAAVSVRCMTQV